eukprot:scaffold68660_cov54-Phaeocystis_antarctica.AAC.5
MLREHRLGRLLTRPPVFLQLWRLHEEMRKRVLRRRRRRGAASRGRAARTRTTRASAPRPLGGRQGARAAQRVECCRGRGHARDRGRGS